MFVRKTSTDADYDIRLIKQCRKQRLFNKLSLRTPFVLQRGFTSNGRFYFDMDFIEGKTLATELFNLEIDHEDKLISDLFKHVDTTKKKENPFVNKVFRTKIDELKRNIKTDSDIDYVFNKLSNFDFSLVPMTLCAGDLTLENIIYKEGKVYIIDLLDSFFSSWLIDIAKLRQDTFLGWSYRKTTLNDEQMRRLFLFDKKLKSELEERDETGYLLIASKYILLLNILRIIPYCHVDDEDYNFCKESLDKILVIELS